DRRGGGLPAGSVAVLAQKLLDGFRRRKAASVQGDLAERRDEALGERHARRHAWPRFLTSLQRLQHPVVQLPHEEVQVSSVELAVADADHAAMTSPQARALDVMTGRGELLVQREHRVLVALQDAEVGVAVPRNQLSF